MSIWDNVKKFAQPYSDDEYDDYDEEEESEDEEVFEDEVIVPSSEWEQDEER